MKLASRLRAVWRTRGTRGFARFIGSRIFSHRRDIVFEAATVRGTDPAQWDRPVSIVCVCRENLTLALSPRLVEQLSRGEDAEYLEGLRGQDMLLAVLNDAGDILHHSFILFETRTKALLDEDFKTPLFAHCVTRPEARGRHLYPQVLRYGLRVLGEKGHSRAVINCDPSNHASIRGIERAGFRMSRELRTWSIASKLCLQTGRDRTGERLARIYLR